MKKKNLLRVTIVVFAVSVSPLYAGVMDTVLDGMYANTTAPSAYQSQTRGGYVFGSLVARTPVRSINLMSFDPPRLSAGCGGIDMYMGSFSFISSDQIVATLRAIGQNAKGLLFQLALQTINNQLSGMLSQWADKLAKLNDSLKNTCAIANMIVQPISDGAKAAIAGKSVGAAISTDIGQYSDSISASLKGLFKPDGDTDTGTSGSMTAAQITQFKGNPNLGNQTWRALSRTGAADRISSTNSYLSSFNGSNSDGNMQELLMNVIGTVIYASTPADTNDRNGAAACGAKVAAADGSSPPSTSPTTQTCEKQGAEYPPMHNIVQNLIDPQNTQIHGCSNPATTQDETGCQQLIDKSLSTTFKGTSYLVNQMLFGVSKAGTLTDSDIATSTDGILYRLQNNQTPTTAQQAFISSIPMPLVKYLIQTQRNPGAATAIAVQSSEILKEDMAIKLARALYEAGKQGWAGKDVPVAMPDLVKTGLLTLQQEILNKEKPTAERIKYINEMNTLVSVVSASLPSSALSPNQAISVGGRN